MKIQKPNTILLATLVALVIITIATWAAVHDKKTVPPPATESTTPHSGADSIRDIQPTDHVLGNPAAPLVFVVYGDFECPYCKQFYTTMRHVLEMYGTDGQVAWVFRHMPIAKAHEQSPTYALASECVAQEGGNSAFWKFSDLLFATLTPDHIVSSADLVALAGEAGVSTTNFTECMRDGTLMTRVETDFNEALKAGANETPYTVIITPYQHIAQSGTLTFPAVAGMIKVMLRNLGNRTMAPNTNGGMVNTFESNTPPSDTHTQETSSTE